jgi:hypothetical protein
MLHWVSHTYCSDALKRVRHKQITLCFTHAWNSSSIQLSTCNFINSKLLILSVSLGFDLILLALGDFMLPWSIFFSLLYLVLPLMGT